ncbi:RagB/SusD family nutrient uptake outer membrane protein [Algoriphagus aquimarinus]|uniref:Starch-binding associating with outer membrane n=1 Tax=Algoriphagus aquimarinus TaxID=237018 RepID=A0A1I0ZTA4_9BACT|nr:RagB/SusD family nutrient uptake outer membrane protein [Algoriphagus aquimarinus]SFB27423.1 Starch-binding associating with outer membrane [Algoriphagus aquimarinus]
MKRIYKFILPALFLATFSCNENEWLEEKPLDFYTPSNSFSKASDFNSAVARIYQNVFTALLNINSSEGRALQYPTDIAIDAIDVTHDLNLYADKLTPTTGVVQNIWSDLYRMIFDANVILGRIDDTALQFDSEAQRNALKAEAMFFRGFAYRTLAILYGGVPIILEEITTPRRDFVRASKQEVMDQVISDLMFAAGNLPEVNELKEDGRLTKAAANHLLAEVYITTANYAGAIAAATKVIDNPNYRLMTDRFGSRKGEEGDVYWDLFRRNNQNRTSGNMESIWVRQFEYLVEGGGADNPWPRFLVPLYWQLTGSDGKNLFTGPLNQYGGRGIGWFAPTSYVKDEIWANDAVDMRNSSKNIIRDIVANNPASAFFGQKIVESGAIDNFPNTLGRWWNVIFAKVAPIGNFPEEYVINAETGLVNGGANGMATDQYIFRLAETYLLRAEAHLGQGDLASAAQDINALRERAHATPAAASEIDIDYILDERARELAWEELRLLTLMRVGKLVERVKAHNPVTGDRISAHQNLWPIPFREIETNTEAVMEQNPGYF